MNFPDGNKIITEDLYDALGCRKVIFLKRVRSTNIVAKNLARKGCSAAVISAVQTAGKGSHGRRWESDADKGLYMSLATCGIREGGVTRCSSVAAVVAVFRSVRRVSGLCTEIKWPNDLMVGGRKLCGILSEAMWGDEGLEYLITGIGINVNQNKSDLPDSIREIATSIFIESGKTCDMHTLAYDLIRTFDGIICESETEGAEGVMKEYISNCRTVGKEISVSDGGKEIFRGRAEGIGAGGSLIVRSAGVLTQEFDFGEVTNREI
ncbi:MAG: biotin--[Synergistes sp.]|nr:biotin--[acetyl-CoA-carboxylase] ligase [Synergistes sp.]